MTEKLLTYALGRGLEYYDMPVVRAIVRDAAAQRLPVSRRSCSAIVKSAPFQMKKSGIADGRPLTCSSRKKAYLPPDVPARHVGATLALPLLDAMVPALTPLAQTAGRSRLSASASSTSRTARS